MQIENINIPTDCKVCTSNYKYLEEEKETYVNIVPKDKAAYLETNTDITKYAKRFMEYLTYIEVNTRGSITLIRAKIPYDTIKITKKNKERVKNFEK